MAGNGGSDFINPTSIEFYDGVSTDSTYVFKAQGSYTFPWDVTASANLNVNQGAARIEVIDGPGSVYGGVNSSGGSTTISCSTLQFQRRDKSRFDATRLLDVGVQQSFRFRGGRDRLKLMLDGFNLFNVNTVTAYSSDNRSLGTFTSPRTIIPRRVFRVGASITF